VNTPTLAAACLLVCGSMLHAQVPVGPGGLVPGPPRAQVPARDTPAPPTGTARIRGRVVAADTGLPLRRAQIRVNAGDIRVMRMATTDAEGRYEIAGLPAGRYAIFVARNGFVTLQFGQQRPFEPGRPLEVAEAQTHDRIDFALPRGGVIAGKVTDELGEPVVGVRMSALRHRYTPTGERQLMPANPGGMFNIVTNDLGEFRVFGLMPGTYLLSADPDTGGFMSMPGGGIMPPGGGTSGETEGFATTYYPGTVSTEDAQPVAVGIAEVAVASFALSTARLAHLSGIVRNSSGSPVTNANVALAQRDGYGRFFRGGPPLGPDGRFSIAAVPPGDYTIQVMPNFVDMRRGIESPEVSETASFPITVAGRDIADLIITTSPGATITGQVTFQGTSTAGKPDRVVLQPADPRAFRPGMFDGEIDASGRFQLRGASGRVLFRTTQANPMQMQGSGWQIKSVTVNGADITDIPLDIAAVGDVAGVEIVVSDTSTTISGTVTNSRRLPIKDYVVAIFPDRLKEGAVPMRFIRTARPDQDGRFQTRGLPPGDYFAVAVPSLEAGDEWDPAFRKRAEPLGRRFRLSDGQSATIDLPLQE
jgi:hypothetical protein